MFERLLPALICGTLTFAAPSSAAAQQGGDEVRALLRQADSLNSVGHGLRAREQLDSARATYLRAFELWSAAGDLGGQARALGNLGNVHSDAGRPDSALAYYHRSIQLARQANNDQVEANTVGNAGLAYRDLGRADSAALYFRRSLRMAEQLRDTTGMARNLVRLAELNSETHADSAMEYYRRALSLNSVESPATLHYDIGSLFARSEQVDSARHHFGRSAELYAGGDEPEDEAYALTALGDAFLNSYAPDSALKYYRRALPLYRAAGGDMAIVVAHRDIGRAFNSLGAADSALFYFKAAAELAVRMGDLAEHAITLRAMSGTMQQSGLLDSALVLANASRALEQQRGDSSGMAVALYNIGTLHKQLGRVDLALAYLDSAIAIQRSAGALFRAMVALQARAGYLRLQREYDRAAEDLTEAYELANQIGSRVSAAGVLAELARLHRSAGHVDSARTRAREALEAQDAAGGDGWTEVTMLVLLGEMSETRDSSFAYLEQALAAAERSGDSRLRRSALSSLGEAHGTLGETGDALAYTRAALDLARRAGDRLAEVETLMDIGHEYKRASPPDWALAAAHYDSAWVALESIRVRTGADDARTAFAEQPILANVARHLSGALGKRALETRLQSDYWLEVAAMERGRARGLLDMMRGAAAHASSPDLRVEAERLRRAVSSPGLATLAYAVGRDTLSLWVTLPTGDIHVFLQPVPHITLVSLVGEVRGALGVGSAGLRAAGQPLEPVDPAMLRGFETGHAPSAAELSQRLQALADWVLPPAALRLIQGDGSIQDLIIVADNVLLLVPFAALPLGGSVDPLGVSYRLRYTPSLTALIQAESLPRLAAKRHDGLSAALVVGNPTMPEVRTASGESQRLSPLLGAEQEAHTIARRLGAPLLRGDSATEAEVWRRLHQAPVVHLATHGYAYATEARQRDSFIALAPGSGHDGLLTVGEVLDSPQAVNAELVVLSACQTALGQRTMTEGTVGLQRAFLARGARSLLVSLWSVDDAVTQQLMESFYAHWMSGTTKSEALRLAQTEVRITNPNPLHWAAFQLVGAD